MRKIFYFSCCDIEPAILGKAHSLSSIFITVNSYQARNILLFSLIIDNAASYGSQSLHDKTKIAAIWNLFYHFQISKEHVQLLQKQSEKLPSFSETPEMWIKSPYSCLSFVSLQTLQNVRKIWEQYAVQRTMQEPQIYETPIRQEISMICKKIFPIPWAIFHISCRYTLARGGRGWDAISGYWKTGVVAGNKSDIKALGTGAKGVLNPTFMVSNISESFVFHYTSDPLHAYHVSHVFNNSVRDKDVPQLLENLAASAKNEFR